MERGVGENKQRTTRSLVRLRNAVDPAAAESTLETVKRTALLTLGVTCSVAAGAVAVNLGVPLIGDLAHSVAQVGPALSDAARATNQAAQDASSYVIRPEPFAFGTAWAMTAIQYYKLRDLSRWGNDRNSEFDRTSAYGIRLDPDATRLRALVARVKARSLSIGIAATLSGLAVYEFGEPLLGNSAAPTTGRILTTAGCAALGVFAASARKSQRLNKVLGRGSSTLS